MRIRSISGFFVTFLVIIGCSTFEEYESEPNIYVVLSTTGGDLEPWESHAKIGITLGVGDTVPIDTFEWGPQLAWNGVEDAEVVLDNGNRIINLYERTSLPGEFYIDYYFYPDEKWKLEVTYPDGIYIEAQVTIPGEFELTAPLGDTFSYEDSITWSRSERAKGYGVWSQCWRTYVDDEDSVRAYWKGHFYGLLSSKEQGILVHYMEGDSVVFHITALDSNLYDYIYCGVNHVSNPRDYMHIEGAWGVFGAQTVVSRRYYLPPPDTSYPPVSRCTKACLRDGYNR